MRRADPHFGRHLFAFIAMIAVAAGFLVWLLTLDGGLPTLSSTQYELSAVLPDSGAQLVPGARVTMAGVQVGQVGSVSRRGADAVVDMKIDHAGVIPLPADSRAQVRTRTPLGENYLQIQVGHATAKLPSGGVIGIEQAQRSVNVDQVLSVLSGSARRQARRMIQSLGGAVSGRGAELNALLGSGASTVHNGSAVVDALVGQRRQISQLVTQLGDLTAGIGQQGADIRQLAGAGLTSVQAVADRDASLRRLLDVLPRTLGAVRATTGRLRGVTVTAAPVLLNLAATLDAARPAARLLAPASRGLHGVVSQLGAAAPGVRAALAQLPRLAPAAAAALPQAHRLLCQINPVLRYAGPYTRDILSLFTEFGASANTYDATGHTLLLDPSINQDAYVGQTPQMQAAINTLISAGLFTKTSHLTYKPFPGPGQANDVATTDPGVSGPQSVKAQTRYVYPHILSDC